MQISRVAPLASGVANRLNLAWIPLFFLCFFKLLEDEKGLIRNIALAACMFLLATIGCWLYGLYVFMLCAFLSLFVLMRPVFSSEHDSKLIHYRDLVLKKMLPLVGTRFFLAISSGRIRTRASSGNAEKALKA